MTTPKTRRQVREPTKPRLSRDLGQKRHSIGCKRQNAKGDKPFVIHLKDARSGFGYAASAASFFFLRQPNRPNTPMPVAKSGSAAGSGVAAKLAKFSAPSAS